MGVSARHRLAMRFGSLDGQRQSPALVAVEAAQEGRSSLAPPERAMLDRLTVQVSCPILEFIEYTADQSLLLYAQPPHTGYFVNYFDFRSLTRYLGGQYMKDVEALGVLR